MLCRVEFAKLEVGDSEIVMCPGISRRNADRLGILGDGIGHPPEQAVCGTEIVTGTRMIWIDFEGSLIVADGSFQIPLCFEMDSQREMRLSITGVALAEEEKFLERAFGELTIRIGSQNFGIVFVVEQQVERHLSHFIGRFWAEEDPDSGDRRIAWVFRGVVEGQFHVQRRSFRKRQRFHIRVAILPVEVPVFDSEQPLFRAVGKDGPALNVLPQVVSVGSRREQRGIDWQNILVVDGIRFFASGDIDFTGDQCHEAAMLRRRMVREIERDRGLQGFWLASPAQMQLQDQICSRVKRP